MGPKVPQLQAGKHVKPVGGSAPATANPSTRQQVDLLGR